MYYGKTYIELCKKYGTIPKTMELWLPMGIAMVNLKKNGITYMNYYGEKYVTGKVKETFVYHSIFLSGRST